MRVAHLAFDFRARRQGRHRVHDDQVDGAAANQGFGDFQRLLARVGLRHEEVIGLHAKFSRIGQIQRMLRIDERGHATGFLHLGDRVQGQGCLARRLRAKNLDDTPPRKSADAKRNIQAERSRRNRRNVRRRIGIAELHDRPLPILFFNLG